MRRRGAAALVAAVAALVPAAPAGADTTTVGIGNLAFQPPRVTVVAGDDVVWRNSDFTAHTATAVDGTFASAPIGRGGAFAQRFATAGAHPYYCTIHPGMRGEVDVVDATLHGPATVLAGETLTLSGRTVAGTPSVLLQQQPDSDPTRAWLDVATLTPDPDGTFSADVAPAVASTYRVLTPLGPSPGAPVAVTARVDLTLSARRTRHGTRVTVRAAPAPGRLVATLQRYVRDRFAFRSFTHTRLAPGGTATFVLRARPRGPLRVVLARAAGGPAIAVSPQIILRDDPGSPSRMRPPAPHHG